MDGKTRSYSGISQRLTPSYSVSAPPLDAEIQEADAISPTGSVESPSNVRPSSLRSMNRQQRSSNNTRSTTRSNGLGRSVSDRKDRNYTGNAESLTKSSYRTSVKSTTSDNDNKAKEAEQRRSVQGIQTHLSPVTLSKPKIRYTTSGPVNENDDNDNDDDDAIIKPSQLPNTKTTLQEATSEAVNYVLDNPNVDEDDGQWIHSQPKDSKIVLESERVAPPGPPSGSPSILERAEAARIHAQNHSGTKKNAHHQSAGGDAKLFKEKMEAFGGRSSRRMANSNNKQKQESSPQKGVTSLAPPPKNVPIDEYHQRVQRKMDEAYGTTDEDDEPVVNDDNLDLEKANAKSQAQGKSTTTGAGAGAGATFAGASGSGNHSDDDSDAGLVMPVVTLERGGRPPVVPGAVRITLPDTVEINEREETDPTDRIDATAMDDVEAANQQEHRPENAEEIAAELIDEEEDRKRLQKTLQEVIQSQDAVQVVDVEAEDRLKRERERQYMFRYFIMGIILAIIIITAVVITVRKNAPGTTAPTEVPSSSPTVAPTSRFSAVENAIIDAFGPLEGDNDDEDSPQRRAIRWMTDEDMTTSFPLEDEESEYAFYDRYAVVVLAYSTDYLGWNDNENWLDPEMSACDWKGLSCNDDGRISVIDLAVQNLQGTLPSEMGVMDNLDFVFMFRNGLRGTIPSEIGKLGDVDFMYLNENQLTGTLPDELAGLLDADDLFLFGNQLSGTIPEGFGDLVDLVNLYLHDNKLQGTIPASLHKLKRVQRLYLQNNELEGTIPPELGSIISLERLQLQNNSLTGSVPASLGSFLGLSVLTLQENMLTGSMPPEVCELTEPGSIDRLEVLEADCNPGSGFNCSCCSECY